METRSRILILAAYRSLFLLRLLWEGLLLGLSAQVFRAAVAEDRMTNQVMRTGRSCNLEVREAQHARDAVLKNFQFEPVYRTDIYAEQRGLEQMLHNLYNPTLNLINPIGPRNPNLNNYTLLNSF